MKQIRKVVIPAAGYGTRLYPASKSIKKELFPIVDKDGYAKPVVQLIIEEAVESGIQEVCLIVQPNGSLDFERYFQEPLPHDLEQRLAQSPEIVKQSEKLLDLGRRISYVVQDEPKGFGHAVYCAQNWVGNEPFLLMLGDHIYASRTEIRCAQQLLQVFPQVNKSISAVMRRTEKVLHLYGTISGKRVPHIPRLYEVTELKEKPTTEYAKKHLVIEELPVGEYLCIFGQYILTPSIFDCIQYHLDHGILERGEIQLTNALDLLRKKEGYYAYETEGKYYDIGTPEAYSRTVGSLLNQRC
ncbi:UTP--glucose-1-phosphate uridylyltransferase [Candidatus Poribacteria bacterium]|nr:UTP--glucose-1-phosphate uridylyltransferase [Candidatus Poribacteria bacterium]